MAHPSVTPASGALRIVPSVDVLGRVRRRRCRACLAFIIGNAQCTQCLESGLLPVDAMQAAALDDAGSSAAKDRAKRIAHRPTHGRPSQILVDPRKMRGVRLSGSSSLVGHADEARAAVARDVAALADAAIGHHHAHNRIVVDHLVDSYFNIQSQGRSRTIDDADAGARVTLLQDYQLSDFYMQFVAEVREAWTFSRVLDSSCVFALRVLVSLGYGIKYRFAGHAPRRLLWRFFASLHSVWCGEAHGTSVFACSEAVFG